MWSKRGMIRWKIDAETFQDLINIKTGLLAPLDGFMGKDDFLSVVNNMTLADDKTVWTIPITLDIDEETCRKFNPGEVLELIYNDSKCTEMTVIDTFIVKDQHLEQVFRTHETKHPGVSKEKRRFPFRVGGKVDVKDSTVPNGTLRPSEMRSVFSRNRWKSVVGFQTRNPIHNAHEHLQRIGLEICDALFINPIVGWKKVGDFTEEAVISAYDTMIREFYPKDRVYFAGLKTQMRYAGPREAIFHAIIRKNLGCTHFIIGRDHAGVGGYYGAYDAHKLARQILEKYDLSVELLLLNEPYYCSKCGFVTSNRACSHEKTNRAEISGTIIRDCLKNKIQPPEILMRSEIYKTLINLLDS
jgi:sulfate adenylyltransferase